MSSHEWLCVCQSKNGRTGICDAIPKYQDELTLYKKAYKMLALSFCKNTSCVFCECLSKCKDCKIEERGRDIAMRHFLQKAREE